MAPRDPIAPDFKDTPYWWEAAVKPPRQGPRIASCHSAASHRIVAAIQYKAFRRAEARRNEDVDNR